MVLAGCLINAQPLPAHRPATAQGHDWQMIGRCPVPILLLVWVRSFIEPDFLKTMYRSTIPLKFIWSGN